jgi:hypothetical protein
MRGIHALAVVAGGSLLAALAGCGGGGPGSPTASTVVTRSVRSAVVQPAFDRADAVFAGSLAAADREDSAADTLAARKGSTAVLRVLALRRAGEDRAELALIRRSKVRPAVAAGAAGRRRWRTVYAALVVNAGYRFDAVYVPLAERRDRLERSLADVELRHGRSAVLQALARRVVRVRTRETAAFERSS